MNKISRRPAPVRTGFIVLAGIVMAVPLASMPAKAQSRQPSLIITHDPVPSELRDRLYSKPVQTRDIKPSELTGRTYYQPEETLVSKKVSELGGDLANIQRTVSDLSLHLSSLERENEEKAAQYYADVATISTQLQAGTTPGNPRLVKRVEQAEASLENLSSTIAQLNQLGADAAHTAADASFLLENTRAAYGLSGAVEEDHAHLAELEDNINNTLVVIERLLNNVNDDITRATTYLSSERNNMRTLSLAVSNGDLYGKSLSNRPFSSTLTYASADTSASAQAPGYEPASLPGGPRPLVKIKFDRPDVKYEEPVYMAVNEALQRYPNARFELVAVHTTRGNAAEVAIESTRSRRNAERVLRTLTQMGLPLDRVDLSYKESAEATSNEVQLYIR